MGDMADIALCECFDQDEIFLRYCNESAHIQYEHGLCDELGFMFRPAAAKLDRGPGECPKCNGPTVLKKGKYGKFYGCYHYPECKGSRSL